MTNTTQLYPIKFIPILKDKIWGGKKLREVLNKKSGDNCGESWEVSGLAGDESVVSNGQLAGLSLSELVLMYGGRLLGQEVANKFGDEFPLLIKFIDADEDLSIQVHPSDEQSAGQGKTEMWYVMEVREGATLFSGFNQKVSKEELRESIEEEVFEKYLNRISVKPGDTFFIEANQVHTIGKGILLVEIQQSSDITYRLYDFNRKGHQGNNRDLHVDESFEVMRVDQRTGQVNYKDGADVELVKCPEFVTRKTTLISTTKFVEEPNFYVLIAVEGNGKVKWESDEMTISKGESLLIPQGVKIEVQPNASLTLLHTAIEF